MNRWAARVVGVVMLLAFLFILFYMQRKLIEIAKERGVDTTTIK